MKVENKDGKGNPYHNDDNGQFASANGGGLAVKGFKSANWDRVDPVLIPHIENNFDELFDEYPVLSERIHPTLLRSDEIEDSFAAFGVEVFNIDDDGNVGAPIFCMCLGDVFEKAELMPQVLTSYMRAKSPLVYSIKNGKDLLKTLLTHEYGHMIDNIYALCKNPRSNEIFAFIDRLRENPMPVIQFLDNEIANEIEEESFLTNNSLSLEIFREMADEYNLSNEQMWQKIEDEYGKYASLEKTSATEGFTAAEFLAEGFACMKCLEDEYKTDFMRSFEDKFNKKYNEIIGGYNAKS